MDAINVVVRLSGHNAFLGLLWDTWPLGGGHRNGRMGCKLAGSVTVDVEGINIDMLCCCGIGSASDPLRRCSWSLRRSWGRE